MISIADGGIKLQNQWLPLMSGSVHYWRMERELWPRILDSVREMGFRIVMSYLPWSVHEMKPGVFDFGEYDPRKDIKAFLSLLSEREMYFLARPGPHINAEITYFGYPKRLFADPEMLAVSSTGSPVTVVSPPRFFPAISYAGERIYEEFGKYLDELCPILAPLQYPDGPIIGIQPDNEMSSFFRTAAYDNDYHPAAKKQYRIFLTDKYKSVEALSAAYRKRYESFDRVAMPTSFAAQKSSDLTYYLDWMEFKEQSLIRPLRKILAMYRERGLTRLLTFHNFPSGQAVTPFNYPALERELDIAGIDSYQQAVEEKQIRDKLQRVVGQSRLPFVPEFGSGCFLWWKPLRLEDQIFTTLYSLMLGIRAINFYMLADRERWYGAPITEDGEIRKDRFNFYRSLNDLIERTALPSMERVVQVAVATLRGYDRLEKAANLFSPLPPLVLENIAGPEMLCDENDFGFSSCIQIEHARQQSAWIKLLDNEGVGCDRTDTQAAPEILERYRLLIAPMFEFAALDDQQALVDFASGGGTLVIGPLFPEQDEKMQQNSVIGQYTKRPSEVLLTKPDCVVFPCGRGRIVLVSELLPVEPTVGHWSVSLLRRLLEMADVETPFVPEDRTCRSVLYRLENRQILFVANPTKVDRIAEIPAAKSLRLVDVFSGESIGVINGRAWINLAPFTVRVFEVI